MARTVDQRRDARERGNHEAGLQYPHIDLTRSLDSPWSEPMRRWRVADATRISKPVVLAPLDVECLACHPDGSD